MRPQGVTTGTRRIHQVSAKRIKIRQRVDNQWLSFHLHKQPDSKKNTQLFVFWGNAGYGEATFSNPGFAYGPSTVTQYYPVPSYPAGHGSYGLLGHTGQGGGYGYGHSAPAQGHGHGHGVCVSILLLLFKVELYWQALAL